MGGEIGDLLDHGRGTIYMRTLVRRSDPRRAERPDLIFEDGREQINAFGRTPHNAGGHDDWRARHAKEKAYCRQWSPTDLPACDGVQHSGVRIRFVGPYGGLSEESYAAVE